jgi:hypothetical protein
VPFVALAIVPPSFIPYDHFPTRPQVPPLYIKTTDSYEKFLQIFASPITCEFHMTI